MTGEQKKETIPTTILDIEDAQPGETSLDGVESHPVQWKNFPTAEELRAHISNVVDIREQLVDIPEWGVQVLVRGLTAKERAKIVKASASPGVASDIERLYPDMVIASCYHPTEKVLIFKPSDREMLNGKLSGVMERLAIICVKLSALDKESQEQLRKN